MAMAGRSLRILQVGTVEVGGGAASVASSLARGYRARGCLAWLAVGQQTGEDPTVFLIQDDDRTPYRVSGYVALRSRVGKMATRFPGKGWGRLNRSLRLATHPHALVDLFMGREDFAFPGTYRLLDLAPERPDLVHCHNLHGGYFDLRALPWLSGQAPTVWTLHDAWALSGHCAHSFDCERWKTGCGHCPDLTIEPAIRRDATADNWVRKRDIYARSRIYVATPSRWLLGKVEQSMLAPAIEQARVIPNGVDLSVFRPADRCSTRAALGIPPHAMVLLLSAGNRGGIWKDHETLRAAAGLIAARTSGPRPLFVALGGDAAGLRIAGIDVLPIGHQTDPRSVARYHQAADVYLYSARADTFPSSILEALACGTPVVATAVGGIPEQVRPAPLEAVRAGALERLEHATGLLVPAGDAATMAEAGAALAADSATRRVLGNNAARDACERFNVDRQVECYLAWYRTIIDDWNRHAVSDRRGTPARPVRQDRVALD